jgi:hypothetical protein
MGFAGTIGSFFRNGNELIVSTASYVAEAPSTWDKKKWFPRLVRLNESGGLISSARLSQTPIATQAQVFLYAAPFGTGQVLAVWSDFKASLYHVPTATVGVFKYDGTQVAAPITMPLPLNYNMQLGSLPNGDVAWIFANPPTRNRFTVFLWRAPHCQQ